MRPQDRERIQDEVTRRVVEKYVEGVHGSGPASLEAVVHDTLYFERVRLDGERRRAPRTKLDRAFCEAMQRRVASASDGSSSSAS